MYVIDIYKLKKYGGGKTANNETVKSTGWVEVEDPEDNRIQTQRTGDNRYWDQRSWSKRT